VAKRLSLARALLALVFLLLLGAAPGEEDEDLEGVLGGFEDEASPPEVAPDDAAPERIWDLSGSAEISGSVNTRSHESDTGTDYSGLQRLRGRLNLQLDVDLLEAWQLRLEGWGFYDPAYAINGRSDYTKAVLRDYELDGDVGEAWVAGEPLENLDLKIGRQVVIWGRSETLRVLDVLNPLDNREPARVDLEDLRRPLSMLRADAYAGGWSATAIAIPEIRFDRKPVVGSDFFPGVFELREEKPQHFEDTELAGAINGIFSGWDVSFHGAWFWNDQPRLAGFGPSARLVHDRLWMLGSGGNYTLGSWLVKVEVAYLDGLDFFGTDSKSRVDALLGVEYYGIADTTFVVEALDRHLFDYESALRRAPSFTREDTTEIALRLTRNFWNDRLHVTGVAVLLGWDARDGAIARVDVDYDVLDALVVGVGFLLYEKGELPPLRGWADNDRLLFQLKWSF
jgi:uncharacterized protein DUF1302